MSGFAHDKLFMLKRVMKFFFILICVSSCTYNVSMVHTEGVASDVIDSQQEASPEISTDLKLPVNTP